ncbi:hypothetical protein [uncultured Cohaesibacter sp.]|uniref:hypothetical protein n=1 Tax=uncultured Cohaesibacter sp. TaxID=1002546 RepID=UPI0029314129|nr:hypothetical protein [uncultured Cohaesibacter sp.]
MRMKIVETFSCGKATSGYNEDKLVSSDNHFGILDGSRGPFYRGTDVIAAMLDDAKGLIEHFSEDITLEACVEQLVDLAVSHKKKAGFEDHRTSGGFVFSLYSRYHNEIWRVGDCKILNGGREFSQFWSTEDICAKARALKVHALLNKGLSVADIQALADYDHMIDDLLQVAASFLNRENDSRSFGAINGAPVPGPYIERIPTQTGRLVITSDGYPAIHETLEQTEASLQQLLTLDPLCINENMQCKGLGPGRISYDDRSYIAADLSN